jgi:hypothetical protein
MENSSRVNFFMLLFEKKIMDKYKQCPAVYNNSDAIL